MVDECHFLNLQGILPIYWLIEKGTTCMVIFYMGIYDIIVLE